MTGPKNVGLQNIHDKTITNVGGSFMCPQLIRIEVKMITKRKARLTIDSCLSGGM